ncbi:HupE/UreJ family protein [Mesorhizobium amorphae]|uniref:HupE/UreJ family protein n=1 Tax=Mesorhizobium amorphae TaxID=71433 RepID=UPI0017837114|nr:HupE/UreJ family protein [Mesorhizobium amorphae]
MRPTVVKLGAAASLANLAGPACAHVGSGYADGIAAGLAHPLLGLDHLLAMAAVGVWSAVAMPLRVWTAPAAFLAAMSGGAALAFVGVALPAMEGMIALSVLALGLMIVFGAGLPGIAGIGLAGLFALFHGHAHASEAAGATFAYVGGSRCRSQHSTSLASAFRSGCEPASACWSPARVPRSSSADRRRP